MTDNPIIAIMATAYSGNLRYALGAENTIPWRHRGDMKFFRESTTGNIVIVGSKTYRSFGSKPLPGRTFVVLTTDPSQFEETPDVYFVRTPGRAIAVARRLAVGQSTETDQKKIFIAGGKTVYMSLLHWTDFVFHSELHTNCNKEADTFIPASYFDSFMELTKETLPVNGDDSEWTKKIYRRLFRMPRTTA